MSVRCHCGQRTFSELPLGVFPNHVMVRQAKLACSSRWKTGTGKIVAGRPVASVA